MAKVKYKTGEDKLYWLLENNVGLVNGYYIDVPDAIKTQANLIRKEDFSGRVWHTMTEKKRPFDCILVFPNKTLCVECKFMYNKLKPHQKSTGQRITEIAVDRFAWCVIRMIERQSKKTLKTTVKYKVEDYNRKVLYETEDLIKLLKWLKEE